MCDFFSFVVTTDPNGGFIVLSEPDLTSHDDIRHAHSGIYERSDMWVECEWDNEDDLEIRARSDALEDTVREFIRTRWHTRRALVYHVCKDMLWDGTFPNVNNPEGLLTRNQSCKILTQVCSYALEINPSAYSLDTLETLRQAATGILADKPDLNRRETLRTMYDEFPHPQDQIPLILYRVESLSLGELRIYTWIKNLIKHASVGHKAELRKYAIDLILDAMKENVK